MNSLNTMRGNVTSNVTSRSPSSETESVSTFAAKAMFTTFPERPFSHEPRGELQQHGDQQVVPGVDHQRHQQILARHEQIP
ncbi:MAG: hypothetical protein LBR58_07120, partial [Propionibacteriaceae bacterium]|nr:hypothetical protein [Propionibacteriaceae bacterium]